MTGRLVEVAERTWGENVPDWILELAHRCDASTQAAIAREVGISSPAINMLIQNRYGANTDNVETKIRARLMNARVECPVLGEIKMDRCLMEQAMPLSGASQLRGLVYRACRDGCPNFRGKD